ncbi:MAG: glutamate-5-semialdehyde dehydrogenase [Polyangiaceae bacterium]|nr:glutamate-5-semialdehyde dehydrogenase [Polyangiaceae bacterium]
MAEAEVRKLATRAKLASRSLASQPRSVKDTVLESVAQKLEAEADAPSSTLIAANRQDIEAATQAGLDAAMIDRLRLDGRRIRAMAKALREIAQADDPVGAVVNMDRRPNGLLVGRVRMPLGVIAMIYESRPNVTLEAFALCFKSGNAVLLRGGKEARRSNDALLHLAHAALAEAGIDEGAALLVPPGAREEIRELVGLTGLVDLAIPRGGEALIRFVTEHARVPVIQHYKGVCHLFVDEGADLAMAERLVEDGKLVRVGVCNALECLLVDEHEAERFVPRLARFIEQGLEVRGDERVVTLLPGANRASEDDWGREFLAKILAVRVVSGLDGALDHIARYGSNHTEVIATRDYARAQRFLREVDACCVLVNASTRFNDGGELGLGAEMGISTSKLHAYGPMGLEHLTTLKWIGYGDGQTRGG